MSVCICMSVYVYVWMYSALFICRLLNSDRDICDDEVRIHMCVQMVLLFGSLKPPLKSRVERDARKAEPIDIFL